MKWAASMQDLWGTVIGVQNAPLAYIIREIAKLPMLPSPTHTQHTLF